MDELTPFEHQFEGIDFLIGGGSLLAYDMGLGKSLTALWADDMSRSSPLPALITCPSSVVGVWVGEIRRINPQAHVLIFDGSQKALSQFYMQWDYIIMSVGLPGVNDAVLGLLMTRRYRVMIVDEAHYLKSSDARRTQVFLLATQNICQRAEKTWLLTGTPTPNHVGELWSLVKATKPDFDMKERDFLERFCRHKMAKRGKREVRVVAGTKLQRIPELRQMLGGWWLRKKKSEVLNLPPKVRRVVPLYVTNLSAEVDKLLDTPEGRALHAAIASGDMRQADLLDDESTSRFRRLMAEAKADACTEYVVELVQGGSSGVLFWFWHTSAMDRAGEALRSAGVPFIRIDGSVPQRKRTALVAEFQNELGPVVALLQIQAAGTGVTLTKAENEVFAEASWTPSDNAQAEDRAHRIGQNRMVNVDYLAVANSLDMVVIETAARKAAETGSL